jgi:putative hydroxymethylpyrimidine transport system ATP-binding protein
LTFQPGYGLFGVIFLQIKRFLIKCCQEGETNKSMMNRNIQTGSRLTQHLSAPTVFMENVSFEFSGQAIFDSLNFTLHGGQWTCLIGPSGVGKSTLLQLISGSFPKGLTGIIRFGEDKKHKGLTAWMAQKDLLLPWFTVLENVCLGSRLRSEMTPEIHHRATALIEDVGLAAYLNALPSELSGGMRQRVALLRTLMEERPVILMDEPFSALDALTRLKLQDLAAELVKGATVLMVTHDPLEALRLGHRIHVMTGRPARLSDALIPPGIPPRKPGDPEILSLQAELIDRLEAGHNSCA